VGGKRAFLIELTLPPLHNRGPYDSPHPESLAGEASGNSCSISRWGRSYLALYTLLPVACEGS